MKASKKLHKGLSNPPITKENFYEYVKRNESEANKFFLICRNEDSAIVGVINLYLGYYNAEKFAGRGFISEAIALILRYAFKDLKLHRIEPTFSRTTWLRLPSSVKTVLQKKAFRQNI